MTPHSSPVAGGAARRPLRRSLVRAAVVIGVLAWAAGIMLGMQRLWTYKSTPGANATAPATWPGSKLIQPVTGKSTLVMFAHPLCSCTRASLAELDAVLQRSGGRVAAWVLFLLPEGAPDSWDTSTTWEAARRLPFVHVVIDQGGVEADRFRASTSGQVVLYDASGRLQFSGGITGARGHVGDNSGEAAVVSLVNTGTADAHVHEVFGCGLHDPNPRRDTDADGAK
jgi:hypothetical protein